MLLANVVETSRRIGTTSRRLEKVALLAELLRACGEEIEIAVSFLSGAMRQGNIGIGYATLQGAAAAPAANATLTLTDVDRMFAEIASIRGAGTERRKRETLQRLLAQATPHEQEFLSRLLMGELRQGALAGLMLDAVARATGVSLDRIRRAAMMAGGVAAIAKVLMEQGESGLSRFSIRLFQPVQPMLAQTAEDVGGAIHDLGEAALEYKFDGARVQAHKSGDEVRVFSRRLNEVTAAVPEIVEAVRAMPARTLVLDGEVLSLNPANRPQPFQVTMKRFGRKLDVNRMRAELPLTPFWFDLIHLDGASLADESQRRRFAALSEIVPEANIVPHLVTADPDKAEDFLHASLAHGHEGIMAKATEAAYAAGARGQSWLKIKNPRTLDLVILAAEWGHGRRTGLLSNLHLGARDTVKGGFAMLGKTFKGLTDEMLAWQTAELLKIEIARDAYTVYVEPKILVEIAFNEIQISPRYASGLALRFARVKRYRPDKSAADADTFETVQKMAGVHSG
jgi:DNA ligase-1